MSQDNPVFVLCSDDPILEDHLTQVIAPGGVLKTLSLADAQQANHWLGLQPTLIFIDYIIEDSDQASFAQRELLNQWINNYHPTLPKIAVGSTAQTYCAAQARLHGIEHFIDPDNNNILATAQRLIMLSGMPTSIALHSPLQKTKTIIILGSRPGVGASTFAAHLGSYTQDCLNSHNKNEQTALLDLAWPLADSLSYLNLSPAFHFGEALQNLHRLDATLLRTALAHSENGLHVLPLPDSHQSLSLLENNDCVSAVSHLSHFFKYLFIDLSSSNIEQIQAGLFALADEIWLMTDQSITAMVSLGKQVQFLKKNQLIKEKLRLLVNQYNTKTGLSDTQIAEQFDLTLIATLPDCTDDLLSSSSQGLLLTEQHENNPYMRALKRFVSKQFSLQPKKQSGSIWQRFRR